MLRTIYVMEMVKTLDHFSIMGNVAIEQFYVQFTLYMPDRLTNVAST